MRIRYPQCSKVAILNLGTDQLLTSDCLYINVYIPSSTILSWTVGLSHCKIIMMLMKFHTSSIQVGKLCGSCEGGGVMVGGGGGGGLPHHYQAHKGLVSSNTILSSFFPPGWKSPAVRRWWWWQRVTYSVHSEEFANFWCTQQAATACKWKTRTVAWQHQSLWFPTVDMDTSRLRECCWNLAWQPKLVYQTIHIYSTEALPKTNFHYIPVHTEWPS